MFGNENSIESVRGETLATAARSASRPAARPAANEPPIREATGAELAGGMLRRQRAATAEEPVQAERRGLFQRRPAQAAEPDAVAKLHGLYTADKRSTRVYYADYQQKSEVMRANAARITTKLDDRQTVGAMLDLAQSRGWETVKLRGTEDFRREVWVQAQVRGMATEGYKPKATDLQEAERRKVATGPVTPAAKDAAPVKITAGSAPQRTTTAANRSAAVKAAPVAANAPSNAAAREKAEGGGKQAAPVEQRAAQAKAVWGSVEAAGEQARAQDAAKQGVKTVATDKPKAVSEAA